MPETSLQNFDYQLLHSTMEEAVREAGVAALHGQSNLSVEQKSNASDLVTNIDSSSQEIIQDIFSKRFPKIPFLGEEQEHHVISTSTFVVADPLDGTSLFTQKGKDWGISFALIENYQPELGVIFLPSRDIFISARRGQGVTINSEPVSFDQNDSLSECIVGVELFFGIPDEIFGRVATFKERSLGIRTLLSAVGNSADVLQGVTGAYLHLSGGKIWDFAAAALAIEEAGGVVSNKSGEALSWKDIQMDVIFSKNSKVHEEVISALGF